MALVFTLTPDFAQSPFMPMVCLVTGRQPPEAAVFPRTVHVWMRLPGQPVNQVEDVALQLPFSISGYLWFRMANVLFYAGWILGILGIFGYRWIHDFGNETAAWSVAGSTWFLSLAVLATWVLLHFFVVPKIKPALDGNITITFPPRADLAYTTLVQGYTRYRVSLGFETEAAEPPDNDEWADGAKTWDRSEGPRP